MNLKNNLEKKCTQLVRLCKRLIIRSPMIGRSTTSDSPQRNGRFNCYVAGGVVLCFCSLFNAPPIEMYFEREKPEQEVSFKIPFMYDTLPETKQWLAGEYYEHKTSNCFSISLDW